MEYEIENRKSYIYVKIGGIETLNGSMWEIIKSVHTKVLDTAKRTGIYKVLVDCRDIYIKITAIDRFFLASYFVEQNLKHIFKRQPVMKGTLVLNSAMLDPEKFGEKVARNRGLYLLVTDDMDKAIEWLGSDSLVRT